VDGVEHRAGGYHLEGGPAIAEGAVSAGLLSSSWSLPPPVLGSKTRRVRWCEKTNGGDPGAEEI
jgi:hypothetical protein